MNVEKNKTHNPIHKKKRKKNKTYSLDITKHSDWNNLMKAVYNKNTEAVIYHIKQGIDVNSSDGNGRTPLIIGAIVNAKNVMKILIKNGADVNAKDHSNKSAMFYAVKNKYLHLCKILIDGGVNINSEEYNFIDKNLKTKLIAYYGWDPLMRAVYNNNIKEVTKKIDEGFDINRTDKEGRTLLIIAVLGNAQNVISVLVKRGINIKAKDKRGKNAIMYAIEKDLPQLCSLLINLGVDMNTIEDGYSLLMLAAKFNAFKVCSLLIKKGANINYQNCLGRTALMIAAIYNSGKTGEILLNNGADLTIKDLNDNDAKTIANEKYGLKKESYFLQDFDMQKEICERLEMTRPPLIKKKTQSHDPFKGMEYINFNYNPVPSKSESTITRGGNSHRAYSLRSKHF